MFSELNHCFGGKCKKAAALFAAVILICGFTGCDSNEISSTSPDSAVSGLQSMPSEFDFDEAVKSILLFGHKISLPCTIADFGKDFSLNDRVTPIPEYDEAVCQLLYNGKFIGAVTLADWKSGEDRTKKTITGLRIGFGDKKSYNSDDMRIQYYESLNRYSGKIEMCVAGISYTSSSDDVIEILGEPTERNFQSDDTEEIFYQYSDIKRYIRVIFHNGNMVDFYFNIR